MGTSQTLKDCPSCNSRIAEVAVQCPLCTSELGRCAGCRAWIVATTECRRCGKSTAVRARKAVETVEPVEGPARDLPKMLFEADAFPLMPLLLLRLLMVAACCAAIVLAIAASELGPVTRFVRQYVFKPRIGWPAFWGAAAGFLLMVAILGSLIRRFRMAHTLMFGESVKVTWGAGALLLNVLLAAFLVPLTAGIGLPWIYARFREAFYRNCAISARGGRHFAFQGTGDGVLRRCALSLLLFPLGVATGGLLLGLTSWIWVKWEMSNLVVPDRTGRYLPVEFYGSAWGYLGRWMLGWLLTLLTAGIYRPWAKVSEWRWIAAHTQVA